MTTPTPSQFSEVANLIDEARRVEQLERDLAAAQERIKVMENWATQEAALRDAAEARAEASERDAERYRWLRDVHAYHYTVTRYIGGATIPRLNGASLDAAIDAAIAEGRLIDEKLQICNSSS